MKRFLGRIPLSSCRKLNTILAQGKGLTESLVLEQSTQLDRIVDFALLYGTTLAIDRKILTNANKSNETAPPGEPVILDYRNRPVFYDADDPRGNMSAEEADEKRAKAQEHRMRRGIMFEATGVLEPGSSIPSGDPLESADGVLQALTAMLGPNNIAHENIFNVLPNGF
ncbi:hypothetical protein TWF970_003193 [Orbilia oligospora]|uniref:Uncharacterized protein n=1 Tax=Orbilia oligospora TaxID=2813651 RepID=A0A7C8RNS4_ORBOL|nr:hypothetical protein TWF970_003193 [Orbilia oligospora]